MASQAETENSNISSGNKGKLSELQEELEEEISKTNSPNQSIAQVQAVMWNYTPGMMPFQQFNNWSGTVNRDSPYPNPINRNTTGTFKHSGRPPTDKDGSYGGVIYIGTNVAGGANNCAWVLAWHVPGKGTPNKVYVESGPISNYPVGSTTLWNRIKGALDRSSNSSSHVDPVTRAEAEALITATGNSVGLSASFDFKKTH